MYPPTHHNRDPRTLSHPTTKMSSPLVRIACALYVAGMLCSTGVSAGPVARRDAAVLPRAALGAPSLVQARQDDFNTPAASSDAAAAAASTDSAASGSTGSPAAEAAPLQPAYGRCAISNGVTAGDQHFDIALAGVPVDTPCGQGLLDNLHGALGKHGDVKEWGADCDASTNTTVAHFELPLLSTDDNAVPGAVNAATRGMIPTVQCGRQ